MEKQQQLKSVGIILPHIQSLHAVRITRMRQGPTKDPKRIPGSERRFPTPQRTFSNFHPHRLHSIVLGQRAETEAWCAIETNR
jgi:hypothetical protein